MVFGESYFSRFGKEKSFGAGDFVNFFPAFECQFWNIPTSFFFLFAVSLANWREKIFLLSAITTTSTYTLFIRWKTTSNKSRIILVKKFVVVSHFPSCLVKSKVYPSRSIYRFTFCPYQILTSGSLQCFQEKFSPPAVLLWKWKLLWNIYLGCTGGVSKLVSRIVLYHSFASSNWMSHSK